ncbi:MAG: hypothetical protein HYZ28_05100 [Myxococcales bacterium]|nr:hypothetical protein [Myxococcales bacterium]
METSSPRFVPGAIALALAVACKQEPKKDPKPVSIETGIGLLEGTRFEGAIPTDSALGKVAQLAGTPLCEAYFGGPAEAPVGALIVTFKGDSEGERTRSREKCAAAIRTLRVPGGR